jgi:hypothetical protein
MNERRTPEEIIKGLETTSDKIRALANAGYDRVEIAKYLDIRYQHVRNVLVHSGITGGLRRDVEAEREPAKVLVATPEPLEWKDPPVNTAAGLEARLIEMIRPAWNIKGGDERGTPDYGTLPCPALAFHRTFPGRRARRHP